MYIVHVIRIPNSKPYFVVVPTFMCTYYIETIINDKIFNTTNIILH